MATSQSLKTDVLRIAYERRGPVGAPVVLLHGFPDDVRTWDGVVGPLLVAGYLLAALWPAHVERLGTLSVGYATGIMPGDQLPIAQIHT